MTTAHPPHPRLCWRKAALFSLLLATGPSLGCAGITEQYKETVVKRQPVELAPRRHEAGDTIVIDLKWESGVLLLKAVREYGYMADVVERQTVETTIVRRPDSWTPAIVEGAISLAALTTIVVAQADAAKCKEGTFGDGCGVGDAFITAGALPLLLPAGVSFFANVARSTDEHKTMSRDLPTGTVPRSSFAPVSGAKVTLRWDDGYEISAIADAKGVSRFRMMPARSAPGSSHVALLIDDKPIRYIGVVAVESSPPRDDPAP